MKRNNPTSNWELLRRGNLLFLIIFCIILLIWLILYMDSNYLITVKQIRRDHKSIDYFQNYNNANTFEGEKIVHLDLKGAPPKISYYKHFFNLISKLGATGVLIEYEDMFPYYGILKNVSAGNAYSLNDIKKINDIAASLNLKIIPVVQTFGHLEYLLKGAEFQHLREINAYPQVICPTKPETLKVLMAMLTQVIRAHPYSKIIHIGADEVYFIGECTKCSLRISKGLTKSALFLEHVSTVASKIKELYPHMRILVWDDNFRKVEADELKKYNLNKLVEIVVWSYIPDVYVQLVPEMWGKYQDIFSKIWIASAFKGSTGSNKFTTNVEYHLENHRSWMQMVEENSNRIKFEGMMLTGWQRYDHFSILCELLPVAIPSLAMCLAHIRGIHSAPLTAPKETEIILQCKNPYALLGSNLGLPNCQYIGGDILDTMLKFQYLEQKLNNVLDSSVMQGWMTEYNIENNFTNVYLLESELGNLIIMQMELAEIERNLRHHMRLIYDNYTINEWCETYIQPISKKLVELSYAKEKLGGFVVWPKRPLIN